MGESLDKIRLRFTGLTAYFVSVLMTLTGLVFTMLITRRLTAEELGTWRYIGTLISYFIIPANLYGFWATRFTASGKNVLKTLVISMTTASILATAVFMLLSPTFSNVVGFVPTVFLVAALEIPAIYLYTLFESVAYAKKPYLNYYAQLVQEFLKIPIAVILVLFLRLGLMGAIIATVIAFAARAAAMALFLKDFEWGKFSGKTLTEMSSVTWLPLYQYGAGALITVDALIIAALVGSSEPLGYATAIFVLGSVVIMTGTLASGLYPRMLQDASEKNVETVINLVLLFLLPTSLGIVLLADHLLNILRPEYSVAAIILPIAVIQAILFVMSNIMESVILGSERVDFNTKVRFTDLVRSKLFQLPTLNYAHALTYVTALLIAMTFTKPKNPIETVSLWLTVNLVAYIPFFIYKAYMATSMVKFKFPTRNLPAYVVAGGALSLVAYSLKPEKLYVEIVPAISITAPVIVASAAAYFIVLFAINKEFRQLFYAVVANILRMRR